MPPGVFWGRCGRCRSRFRSPQSSCGLSQYSCGRYRRIAGPAHQGCRQGRAGGTPCPGRDGVRRRQRGPGSNCPDGRRSDAGEIGHQAPLPRGPGRRTYRRAGHLGGSCHRCQSSLKALGGYMAERVADVLDVRARIVSELRGLPAPGIPASDVPFILAAEDLAPADTATLDPAKVIALITSSGGPQSHTAIIARALGLPAIVAAPGVDEIRDGTEVYLDGAAGTITVDPGEELRSAAKAWANQASTLAAFSGSNDMADGFRVPLLANVGTGADAVKAADAGAQGVGLLRTEFCFLDRDDEPTVEEQSRRLWRRLRRVPGQEGGGPDPRRRRGQAPAVPHRRGRTQPCAGRPRVPHRSHLARCPRTPAGGDRRGRGRQPGRSVGHGPHDLHGRGSRAFRIPLLCRRIEDPRRHGGSPVGRPDRRLRAARSQLRVARNQRPHPVRHGRGPPTRPARHAQ